MAFPIPKPEPSSSPIGEPTFADVLAELDRSDRVDDGHRRQWSTSLRQMAKYLDRPLSTLPARITAIRQGVMALHPERLGVNAKTFANHRANALAALNWYWSEGAQLTRRVRLCAPYDALWSRVEGQVRRDVLSPFLRFLSTNEVLSNAVGDDHLKAFIEHRKKTSFSRVTITHERQLVRHWNSCVNDIEGWPRCQLTEPDYAARHAGPSWDDLPSGLRADIDAYCACLAKPRKDTRGRRWKPCKPSTIETRRRELIAAVRAAVEAGVSLEKLTGLDALVHPDTAEIILNHYWARNGEEPAIYTIDLATKFFNFAKAHTDLGDKEIDRLEEMRQSLDLYRRSGLTEKNLNLIRQIASGDIWPKVVRLPLEMIAGAKAVRLNKPVRAAVEAQLAVAIRLLSIAPVRLQNLAAIKIGYNLVRPGGPGSPYRLVFQDYDVKNRVPLEFALDRDTTALIDAYIHDFRPNLMRGRNHDALFPGDGQDTKDKKTLSDQIKRCLWKKLGLKITPHQFRHAAAAIILAHDPGNYEFVRRILGHRNIQTTINFYIGLETLTATQAYQELVIDLSEYRGDG